MLRLIILESYMNGKKNQSQLPYFIDEKTEAYSIHFNSDLFSFLFFPITTSLFIKAQHSVQQRALTVVYSQPNFSIS